LQAVTHEIYPSMQPQISPISQTKNLLEIWNLQFVISNFDLPAEIPVAAILL
jgi:hypothetical protein